MLVHLKSNPSGCLDFKITGVSFFVTTLVFSLNKLVIFKTLAYHGAHFNMNMK